MKNQSPINNHQSTIIKVLIVDDSLTTREYMRYLFNADKDFKVVGMAKDGEEAVKMVQLKQPDVVTMDIHMPGMDGYEATRRIMETNPVPIVVVSASLNSKEVAKTFQAIEAGAVTAQEKPPGPGNPQTDRMISKMLRTVKLMSEVKVVKRFAKLSKATAVPEILPRAEIRPAVSQVEMVTMGASTGGPPVIQTILSNLADGFSYPILIVQHIATGFLEGMVDWLSKSSALPLKIPAHGESILGGYVYFAPDNSHMGITGTGKIVLSKSPPENGLRPAVSCLFRSAAKAFGQRAVGVLLTGMGKDGSSELKIMKEKGAITIAQDKKSSIVHGMPGEAIKLNAANHILSPEEIAVFLNSLDNRR